MCKKDIEVMLLPLGTRPTEARFLIRISMDYSRLPSRIDKSHDETMLIITFYGPDWKRIIPQLYLSKTLEEVFGGPDSLHIPPFPHNKCLMDYVPEVKKFIEEKVHAKSYFIPKLLIQRSNTCFQKYFYMYLSFFLQINVVVQCFESRKAFVSILLVSQRGSLIEFDAIEFNSIIILLEQRDFHFFIHFHLPLTFPTDRPQITLQSVYHLTSQGTLYKEVLDDVPYSPRWPITQIVDKLLKYIMENAVQKFQTNSIKNNRF